MTKPALALLAPLAALVVAAGASAGPFGPIASLPAGWSHAQINVVIKRQPHTLTYDRGRVQSVTPGALVLRERDGSSATIVLGPSTRVTIDGHPATVAQIRRLENATTVSEDGGAALAVRVTVPPRVAAALARGSRR